MQQSPYYNSHPPKVPEERIGHREHGDDNSSGLNLKLPTCINIMYNTQGDNETPTFAESELQRVHEVVYQVVIMSIPSCIPIIITGTPACVTTCLPVIENKQGDNEMPAFAESELQRVHEVVY